MEDGMVELDFSNEDTQTTFKESLKAIALDAKENSACPNILMMGEEGEVTTGAMIDCDEVMLEAFFKNLIIYTVVTAQVGAAPDVYDLTEKLMLTYKEMVGDPALN